MKKTIGAQLGEKLNKPLKFQWNAHGAQNKPTAIINGFDVAILIDGSELNINRRRFLELAGVAGGLAAAPGVAVGALQGGSGAIGGTVLLSFVEQGNLVRIVAPHGNPSQILKITSVGVQRGG